MTNERNQVEELLTEHDVARLLRVSVATIRRRRLFGQPPDYIKIGASVRYRREAISAPDQTPPNSTWVATNAIGIDHQSRRPEFTPFRPW